MPSKLETCFSITYSPIADKLDKDGYTIETVFTLLRQWGDEHTLKGGIVKENGEDHPHLHFACETKKPTRSDNLRNRLINYLWSGAPDWSDDERRHTFQVNKTDALAGTVAGYFSKEGPDSDNIVTWGFTDEELAAGKASWEMGVIKKSRKDPSLDKVLQLIAQKLHDDDLGDPASDIGYRERVDDAVIKLIMEGYQFAKHGNRLFGPAAKLFITGYYRTQQQAGIPLSLPGPQGPGGSRPEGDGASEGAEGPRASSVQDDGSMD